MPPKGRPKPTKSNVKAKATAYVYTEEQQSPHRKNLRIVGYPVLFLFGLLRFLLFQFWVTLAPYVCKNNFLQTPRTEVTNSENLTMAEENTNASQGESEPSLVRQRYHHKKAFELISQALQVDESKTGRNYFAIFMFPDCLALELGRPRPRLA